MTILEKIIANVNLTYLGFIGINDGMSNEILQVKDKMPNTFAALERAKGSFELLGLTGWYSLAEELSTKIAELMPDFRLLQIKEKYGEMRYYWSSIDFHNNTKQVWELVDDYEMRSRKTCSLCGKDNARQVSLSNWIHTLCTDCLVRKIGE